MEDLTSEESISGNQAIGVTFSFSDDYSVTSIDLDADFGLPGLGFQSSGTLDAEFDYTAQLALELDRQDGITLNTLNTDASDGTYLNANFNTSLSDDFSLTGVCLE